MISQWVLYGIRQGDMLYTPFKQRKYLLVAATMANIFHELLHMQFFYFDTAVST